MAGKVEKVMHEFKHGQLHSGTGKPGKKGGVVHDRDQAIAIALSEARREGEDVPPPKTARYAENSARGRRR